MHELLLNNWLLTFITGKIVKWTCNFSSASEVFVDIHGAARCCPQSRHIGNLMGKEMVIAPYLTLVQEDTTITWCLIATLQGIKHLHEDEKRREPVSPKAGCQQVTVVGGLGSWALLGDARTGGEDGGGGAETPGAEHRSRSQEQRGQWPLTRHPAHNPARGQEAESVDILI